VERLKMQDVHQTKVCHGDEDVELHPVGAYAYGLHGDDHGIGNVDEEMVLRLVLTVQLIQLASDCLVG
jgi:hypothetical protein